MIKYIKLDATVDVIKCLKQIKIPVPLQHAQCGSQSGQPSNNRYHACARTKRAHMKESTQFAHIRNLCRLRNMKPDKKIRKRGCY